MYNINISVSYNNNTSYRECLRNVCSMDISNLNIPFDQMEDLDDETKDELLFDQNAMNRTMDYVYELTKENTCFKEFYLLGAGQMFSQDEQIGLAVLFSYDYFALFHVCLIEFLNKHEFQENSINYINLKNKIC